MTNMHRENNHQSNNYNKKVRVHRASISFYIELQKTKFCYSHLPDEETEAQKDITISKQH